MNTRLRAPRGVSLLEGLIATLILLTGMVGVLQGVAVASLQNSMATRQARASTIATELIAAMEGQGRKRLLGTLGLFITPQCSSTVPSGVTAFTGSLTSTPGAASAPPPSLTAQGFTAGQTCYIDFDALGASYRGLTPGYSLQDNTTYQRMVAVWQHPTNPEVLYVGVNVGWRDAGQVRLVKRFTAIYDTSTNQTNLEF